MADECGVSRRTVFRDLEILKLAGVPIYFDEEQERFYANGKSYLPPTSFSTEEALALMLLAYELGETTGLPYLGAARSAALKLEASLPEAIRRHLGQVTASVNIQLDARNPLADSEPHYRALLEAIAERRCVRMVYGSLAEQSEIRTKLSPYRLLFSRRSWYVIGRSSLHRAPRTFNLGRIKELQAVDEHFRIPKGFSLARYLRNAWHLIPERGPDVDVRIRFRPLVAANVAEVQWHRTQKVAWHNDGSIDFRVRVSGINEISWWIMGYGEQAEVLEPPALRRLVARNCGRLSQVYERELAALNGKTDETAS